MGIEKIMELEIVKKFGLSKEKIEELVDFVRKGEAKAKIKGSSLRTLNKVAVGVELLLAFNELEQDEKEFQDLLDKILDAATEEVGGDIV